MKVKRSFTVKLITLLSVSLALGIGLTGCSKDESQSKEQIKKDLSPTLTPAQVDAFNKNAVKQKEIGLEMYKAHMNGTAPNHP